MEVDGTDINNDHAGTQALLNNIKLSHRDNSEKLYVSSVGAYNRIISSIFAIAE